MKHSALGIISFISWLVAGVGIIVTLIAAGYLELTTIGGIPADSYTEVMLGFSVLVMCLIHLVGALYGFIGIFNKSTNRFFAMLGFPLNLLGVVIITSIIAYGLYLGD